MAKMYDYYPGKRIKTRRFLYRLGRNGTRIAIPLGLRGRR